MRVSIPLERTRGALAVSAVLMIAAAALVACSPSQQPVVGAQSEQSVDADEPAPPAGLESTDFGDLDWTFRPGGSVPETLQVTLVDGKASDGMVSYELGEVVLAELTDDDWMDAAVQITRLDGNAIDEQWYLWVATDEGPVQVTLPVARMARCGTVTHSVTAVEGGVEIHETRRSVADQSIPCSDPGSDERTRTVAAIEARNAGEWWPVQTAPIGGFGGLCPMTTHLDTYENEGALYPVPDAAATEPIAFDGRSTVFEIEGWPVYGEPFPGWVLTGVQHGDDRGCAWAEAPGS